MLKMYIVIRDDVPLGFALVAAAHAPLICQAAYGHTAVWATWIETSFRKVVCKVDGAGFEIAKKAVPRTPPRIVTESALGKREVALVFPPFDERDEFLASLPLYK